MYRIKTITVKELFGYAGNNYTVELDPVSKINFIYGFNGCGKTTLLRLVYATFNRKLTLLDSISFKSMKISFDNDESLIVERTINKRFDDITINELQKDETGRYYFPIVFRWEYSNKEISEGKYNINESVSNKFERILNDDFDNNSKRTMKEEDLPLSEFYKGLSAEEDLTSYRGEYCKDLNNKLSYIDIVYNVDILYANKDYNRLASSQEIRRKQDDGEHAESIFENYELLDTVPFEYKIVKEFLKERGEELSSMKDITLQEFMQGKRSSDLYDKENKYIVFKIPDKIDFIKEQLKVIMSDYDYRKRFILKMSTPDDNLSKFYEEIASNIEQMHEIREKQLSLFENLINQKPGLTDKDIFIDRSTGDIKVKMFGRDDVLLPIEKLSSGEKNWLLLHFYLIFFTNNNSIILIDEPEVSMHVDWQHSFANNIMEICKEKNIQIIIATHSPDVINENFLLMSEMKKIGEE